ncbi:MAG: helix-turn-helix transcriptional regulator [Clostridia bacterium]|nr:helix-turn-helix transcriptional regulator [Clostridia bacterium]
MTIQKAIAMRISDLMIEKNMTIYALAKRAGVSRTTLTGLLDETSNSMKLITLFFLTEALETTIQDFFNHPYFDSETLDIE